MNTVALLGSHGVVCPLWTHFRDFFPVLSGRKSIRREVQVPLRILGCVLLHHVLWQYLWLGQELVP